MRLGIKAKQVAGVTILVGLAVVLLSAWYLSALARLRLEDTNARAKALALTISQRAFDAIAAGVDPQTVAADPGLQSILTASLLLEDVQYAAIVDPNGVVIAHSLPGSVGQALAPAASLSNLMEQGWMSQMRAIYAAGGQTYEFSQELSLAGSGPAGATRLGAIHVGVSTLLIRPALEESLKTPLYTSFVVVVIASVVAMLLAQVVLRPIHVIRSGLARLGRGELDVKVDLPAEADLEDLSDSFKAVSDRLAADQALLADRSASLDSATVESTLSASRKLVALGRLTAGIAHEVRNPLNAAMIHLELLKMKVADVPEAMDHARTITQQVRRLDEVVQGFLKFTRPEDLKLQPTPLGPLVEDLIPVIAAEASKSNVDVQVDIPATLPQVSADPSMLQQAFLNLALNACQAMPNGGKLKITATPRANRRVDVMFEDTGVGIPPEHLEKIFNLYFTTKEHGTGIGLSMVYRTIQLHDGEVEVQSVVGTGTRFRVTLRQA